MSEKKILIVDDNEINREILGEILGEEYLLLMAENGRMAIECLKQNSDEIGIVLLDLVMPEVDGYAVLDYMMMEELMDRIPVLIITGEESVTIEKRCFAMGVSDFIRKPFDNTLVRRRIKNINDLYLYKNHLEEKVKTQTGTLHAQYKILKQQTEELKKKNQNIIDILGTVVECRDMESGEHIQRVKDYTRILAEQMKEDCPEYQLTDERINIIVSASALHDIGKIAIPDHILLKPAKLTKEEFEHMKQHTTKGCELLKNVENAWDEDYQKISYEICRHHHERYDGKGYPDGLRADEIPISAQLVSIADVYDALVNARCYKPAYSKEEAFHMIVNGECGAFSPRLLEAFCKSRSAFEKMAEKTSGAVAKAQ